MRVMILKRTVFDADSKKGRKNNKLNFFENGPFGTPFLTLKLPPKKLRHINFFLGAQNGGSWVGAKKFMFKKFMWFFPSPI